MRKILTEFYKKEIFNKININTSVNNVNEIVAPHRLTKMPKKIKEIDNDEGYHLTIDMPVKNQDNVFSTDTNFEIASLPTSSLHSICLNFVLMMLDKETLPSYFKMLINRLKLDGKLFIRELNPEKNNLKGGKICNMLLRGNDNINLHKFFDIEDSFSKCGFNIVKYVDYPEYREYFLINGIKPFEEEQLPVINVIFNDLIPFEKKIVESKKSEVFNETLPNNPKNREVFWRKQLSVPPKDDFYWSMVSGYWINEKLITFMQENIGDLSKFDIYDMNAGLGGDVLRFMKNFKNVLAAEIYGPAINHIKNNVDVYLQAGVLNKDNLQLIHGDNIDVLNNIKNKVFLSEKKTSIIYADPPWGDYEKGYIVDISGLGLKEFIERAKHNFSYVVLKIPVNTPEILSLPAKSFKTLPVGRTGRDPYVQFVIIKV